MLASSTNTKSHDGDVSENQTFTSNWLKRQSSPMFEPSAKQSKHDVMQETSNTFSKFVLCHRISVFKITPVFKLVGEGVGK